MITLGTVTKMNSSLGHACSLCGSEAFLCTNNKFAECYVKGISWNT